MSKKDYELIAANLRHAINQYNDGEDYTPEDLARRFAVELQSTNPQFDRARFLKACGVAP